MTRKEIVLDVEQRMEKAIDVLKKSLGGIRTGRANPGLVDTLRADIYGSPTPIKQVAGVSAPEANQIVIRPYDPGTLKALEKAIQASDLGLTPQNDGRIIRITVPPLSTEVRQKMVSRIKELNEEAKIAIRNIRRDGNKLCEQEEKAKTISEDQCGDLKSEIQNLTKKYEEQSNQRSKAREVDVLDV